MAGAAGSKDRRKGSHPTVLIKWGAVNRIRGGKKVKVSVYTRMRQDVASKFGLKEATDGGYKVQKDAKGNLRLSGVSMGTSGRYVLISTGETKKVGKSKVATLVYYRVAIPTGISYAVASQVLKKGGKIFKFKSPADKSKAIGAAAKR